MTSSAWQAAQRLGALDEFLDATEVPEAARAAARLGKPEEFMLVRDGREHWGQHIHIWLARQVTLGSTRYKIIGRAGRLPRSSNSRPEIFAQAQRLKIPCESLFRRAYPGTPGRVKPVRRSQQELTDTLVELHPAEEPDPAGLRGGG